MEKYRFIYFTGEALKLRTGIDNTGTRELHCVKAIFDPNANYEYEERLDLQIETQEVMDTIKNLVVHTDAQVIAWE